MKKTNTKEMINDSKIKIMLMALLAILLIIPMWYKNQKPEVKKDTKVSHNSKDIIKDEIFENLKFTNISLITDKNNMTTFSADVTNISDKENEIDEVYIDLKDKDGNVVISLKANIGNLVPKSTTKINTVAKGKFKEVVSKEIRVFKS